MTRDEKEFVSALRTLLRERVGDGRYELWFGESTQLTCAGQAFCVSAPNQFVLEWLQRNFKNDLSQCLREVAAAHELGQPKLNFQLDQATVSKRDPAEPTQSRRAKTAQSPGAAQSPSLLPEPFSAIPFGDLAPGPGSLPKKRPQHTTNHSPKLASSVENSHSTGATQSRSPRRFASLCEYVVGESNRTAFKAAEIVLQKPGALSPFFVHGPSSVGKTHLLEGIWSEAKRLRRTAVFLTSEQFTSYFVSALKGGGMPSFRRKYRDVDLLLIDDLQFICGKKRTEEELLYTVDSLGRDGRQVILAADRAPADLAGLGPELQTRLQAGLGCEMTYPELPERMGIVRQLASKRELTLADEVVQFIAEQVNSHARELSGVVNRLFAASLVSNGELDLAAAKAAVGESTRRNGPQRQLKEIEKAVCEEFQIDPKQLRSSKKTQDVSQPRMMAMWLARKYTRAALSEIGNYFGGRSHSTVVSAQKKVNQWVESHQALHCSTGEWTADEAVRRLEARLRIG